MKYLCIDYGQKRTGIAVTDALGTMAFPRCTMQMQGRERFVAELLPMLETERVEAIVVGLPLYLDGTVSETTRQVLNMLALLRKSCTLPIYLVEESLTSFTAEERLKAAGSKLSKRKDILDQAAAVEILESFLETSESKRVSYDDYAERA